ncbi:MAG: ketoacyl-synthetase C-terminal extension domain-containing protein [Pirellulaceae bacterium]
MQRGVIPPSINVEQLNQSIPWQDIPLSVLRSPEAWPSLPAGHAPLTVNAFGIGGLNVHVVVEQAAESETRPGNPRRGASSPFYGKTFYG